MALFKNSINEYGVEINYYKISNVNINFYTKTTEIVVQGFTSEEARKNNMLPLMTSSYTFDSILFDPSGDIRIIAYKQLKDRAEFDSSKDV